MKKWLYERGCFFNDGEKKFFLRKKEKKKSDEDFSSISISNLENCLVMLVSHRWHYRNHVEFGNLKGKEDDLKQCGNTGMIMTIKPTGKLILECLEKAFRS